MSLKERVSSLERILDAAYPEKPGSLIVIRYDGEVLTPEDEAWLEEQRAMVPPGQIMIADPVVRGSRLLSENA
jgi:hypothetical protein